MIIVPSCLTIVLNEAPLNSTRVGLRKCQNEISDLEALEWKLIHYSTDHTMYYIQSALCIPIVYICPRRNTDLACGHVVPPCELPV